MANGFQTFKPHSEPLRALYGETQVSHAAVYARTEHGTEISLTSSARNSDGILSAEGERVVEFLVAYGKITAVMQPAAAPCYHVKLADSSEALSRAYREAGLEMPLVLPMPRLMSAAWDRVKQVANRVSSLSARGSGSMSPRYRPPQSSLRF